jgi:hypothetical protein
LFKEVTSKEFLQCVKVSIKEVREILPEDRINAIAIKGEKTTKISLKLKGK